MPIPGLEATAVAAVITSEQGLPLAVERTMFWDASYYAATPVPPWRRRATQWYFAEGAQGFFDTFILVNNPNPPVTSDVHVPARARFTGPKTVTVGGKSRYTLPASGLPGFEPRASASPPSDAAGDGGSLDVLRHDRDAVLGGGTESPGTSVATTWFFAEGATGGFFDTFFLLGNPQGADAHVTLTYLLDSGEMVTVPRRSRARATDDESRGGHGPSAEEGGVCHDLALRRADGRRAVDVLGRARRCPGAKDTTASAWRTPARRGTLAEGRAGGPLSSTATSWCRIPRAPPPS